ASLLVTMVALSSGCVLDVFSVFDPGFLTAAGLSGSRAATLPGDAPAVLVRVENQTSRIIDVQLAWREGAAGVETQSFSITPGVATSQALICPVTEITIGDVSDLTSPGARVRLGAGGANDPFVTVEPFGILLKEGINYDCGDAVMFQVTPSSETASGYRIFAFIQRASNS
ncbi:MAG: hypothetical protein AB7N71_14745, partial [Phycisphaerae bacterium]